MGNGYNHHQNIHFHHKATFMPMLCSRLSVKDVPLPNFKDRSVSFSTDPLSPKIGCMGQVKRHNKYITITRTLSTTLPVVNYSKLKRIFSAKNSFTGITTPNDSGSCRRRGAILNGPKIGDSKEDSNSIRIEDMDPPLPVIKKVHQPAADGEEVETLWKRRSSGASLKNLQLQQIQLNRQNLPPTTV